MAILKKIFLISLILIFVAGGILINQSNTSIKEVLKKELLPVVAASGENWWNTSFSNRIQITFNNTNSTENLTNFPILVVLNSTRINYSLTQDLGQDIRFVDADNITILPYEIELWNESNISYVWVNVPQIDNGSTTDYIWMYYGNSTTGDAQNITGTWDANYVGVWHLKETDIDGGAGDIKDSTSNANNGTTSGMDGDDQVAGEIDGSFDFDATDDNVNVGTLGNLGSSIESNGLTMSAWIKTTNDNAIKYVGGGWSVSTFIRGFGWTVHQSSVGSFSKGATRIIMGNDITASVKQVYYDGDANFYDGNWHYLTAVMPPSTTAGAIYLDGTALAGGTSGSPGTTSDFTRDFRIGARDNGEGSISGFWLGSIDEFRISNSVRSADWIEAEYHSQKDGFNTYGSSESQAADTCTYSSGNWAVLCSDNCVITSNIDLGGNNITITGTGTFRTTANISNWKNLLIQGTSASNICYVKTDSGGGFKE